MSAQEIARAVRYRVITDLRDGDWSSTVDAVVRLAAREADRLGVEPPADGWEALAGQVESLLDRTEPGDNAVQQSELIADLIGGAVSTSVALASGPDRVKTWVTAQDADVRPSHAALHGVTVDVGDDFSVGGHRMSGPHDPTAPIEELANCRCFLQVEEKPGMAASATPGEDEGPETFIVAMLPASGDPIEGASSEVVPHITTLYLPKGAEGAAQAAIEAYGPLEPITAEVMEVGELGDEGAQVAFLNRDVLGPIREALLTPEIEAALAQVDQYPDWTPHITLGYPESPAPAVETPAAFVIDRLAIVDDDQILFESPTAGESMPPETETETPDAPEVAPTTFDERVPFHGVAVVEDQATGDLRKFASGALTWPDTYDLAWCKTDTMGHDGAVVVGRVTETWREGNEIRFRGVYSETAEANELLGHHADGTYTGVSVDVDDSFTAVFETRDGQPFDMEAPVGLDTEPPVTVMQEGRIRGLTTVRIPAFIDAWIAPGDWPEDGTPPAPAEAPEDEVIVAAAALDAAPIEHPPLDTFVDVAPGVTEDGPGWLTHPVDTDRLRDYWVSGPGAAKIGWGMPGDFRRCEMNLAEYIKPQHLAGYCANRHKDALGVWPGQHSSRATAAGGIAIVASGGVPTRPPKAWFEDPHLAGPSAIVVTEDGRMYGHLATWGTCHIGIPGSCVTPPESPSGYAYYRTGAVLTAEGEQVAVGPITMGTGHADLKLKGPQALAHYDNTGTAVADVAAGQDEYGIWVAGAVRPGATEDQIYALRGSALSGDWRRMAGNMELIAALAVNVPGFPVPRVALAASAGEQEALVASGVVTQNVPLVETVEEVVERALATREARTALATMARDFRRSELDAIKAKVN